MKLNRTYMAVLAVVASTSLLAACSKEDDASAPVEPVAPAPSVTEQAAPPVLTPEPVEPSVDESAAESAQEAQESLADKAAELKEDAADAAERARQAVADAAAKADRAIQDTIGNKNGQNAAPADAE